MLHLREATRDKKQLDFGFSKHRPSGPMLSISRNVRLSVDVSVDVSVRLFTFEVPFKRLFAPTSRSRMFFADFAVQNMLKTTLPDG